MIKSAETMTVSKVDKGNRLVVGWGMVCKKNDEPYFDTDNQHFPEDLTIKAWIDFMKEARVHKAMHSGNQVGEVVFAFPATKEFMESLGMQLGDQSGMLVGVQVADDDTLNKFHDGTYKGFSVGGSATFEDQ